MLARCQQLWCLRTKCTQDQDGTGKCSVVSVSKGYLLACLCHWHTAAMLGSTAIAVHAPSPLVKFITQAPGRISQNGKQVGESASVCPIWMIGYHPPEASSRKEITHSLNPIPSRSSCNSYPSSTPEKGNFCALAAWDEMQYFGSIAWC